MLGAHFITGDGRGNENIGLTAVHHVFHAEHNRLVGEIKDVILEPRRARARRTGKLPERRAGTASASSRPPASSPRWSTSTSSFEEFARKVQPTGRTSR